MRFQFLDKLGAVGAFLAAASCPACFPILAVAGSALGLGFLKPYEGVMIYVLQGLVILSLVGSISSFMSHRKIVPLVVSSLGFMTIFFTIYIRFDPSVLLVGLGILFIAGVVNYIYNRKCDSCIPKQGGMKLKLTSILRCPKCGFEKEETMPMDTCQFFYTCSNCDFRLRPKKSDCCVFCSYGSVRCPSKQEA